MKIEDKKDYLMNCIKYRQKNGKYLQQNLLFIKLKGRKNKIEN